MKATITRDAIPDLIRQRYPKGGERILLVGPPGTGKTALAIAIARNESNGYVPCPWKSKGALCRKAVAKESRYCAAHTAYCISHGYPQRAVPRASDVQTLPLATQRPWYQCTLTSETLESRIWCGLYPNLTGGMDERKGPGALAWEVGGLWIVNELHRGSADCHERIINALDDPSLATDTTSIGTILKPHSEFGCIATQNAPSTVLADALRDRFALRIAVAKPSTAQLDRLDPDVRLFVSRAYDALEVSQWEEGPRPSYRDCLSFCEARAAGIDDHTAAMLIIDGEQENPGAFLDSLKMLAGEAARQSAAGEDTVTLEVTLVRCAGCHETYDLARGVLSAEESRRILGSEGRLVTSCPHCTYKEYEDRVARAS